MSVAPIRTVDDHARAMRRIREIFDAAPGTALADELEVLATLVAQYERSSIPAPTPIEAIRFRMDQAGLSKRDLEPLLGSRSRVSEIMAGTRGLTVDMMRALSLHLGIPADALLGTRPAALRSPAPTARALAELRATGLMREDEPFPAFIARAMPNGLQGGPSHAHLRNTRTERTNAKTDVAALQGWCAAVLLKSAERDVSKAGTLQGCDEALGREIAALSAQHDGIQRVPAFLADRGISLVLLRHFPGTFLDGAAMRREDGVPVIGLTLRYDRIDNFWFTLLHEFAHVACHLDSETSMILDDLEIGSSETIEHEADTFAQRVLIPDQIWLSAHAAFDVDDVHRMAEAAGVHPAVVAGRWQREFKDYRRFSKLVGHGEVRRLLGVGSR